MITNLNQEVTKEQITEQVAAYNEIPLNQYLIIAKPMAQFKNTGKELGLNPIEMRDNEIKTFGQMVVIAKADDVSIPVEVGDIVRVLMFRPFPEGVKVNCTIPNYELLAAKQFDILTVEKK